MRSQHQNKQSRPNIAQIKQGHCQVCFVSFDRALPKRIQEGIQILFCSHCHITVHKGCYDFQPNVTILSQQVSQFLCERCKFSAGKQVHCMVCYGQEGAMKSIGENEFIHVYCGLVHNDIDVISYYPTISFRKSLQYQELSNICEICLKKNAHQKCTEDSCRPKVHTYCAKATYVKLGAQNDQPHSWNHHISQGNHGSYDLSQEIISYELYSDEVELLLKEISQAEIQLPNKQNLKHKIHKEYINELRGKRKTTKKLRRGGFSFLLCPQHESTIYCVCQSKEEGEMVLCQCCFEWYHQKCINYREDSPQERFICHFCKVFYEFKRKAVQQVRGGRADADINKIQLPLRFSVADCMWVIRVIDNRIRGGQASKMLKQLSKYPLKSSCLDLLIRQQNRNKLNALAQSFVQQLLDSSQIVSNLRPRPVLSLGSDGEAMVVRENVEYNLRLRKVVQVLVGLGIPSESISGLQAELDFKQRAVSDQYETIIELSKSTEAYQEVPILKQKAQAFNFIDIVQKIQQKNSIPYQTLLDALQKAVNNSHVPPYMLTIISQKITQIQPLIKLISALITQNPQNMQKITSVVQQLEEQYIQAPSEYLQLKNQRKFIQDLHLYYIRYNPSKIQQQKSIAEQIELLLGWTNLKPSQEFVQLVNFYRPVTSTHVWKRTADLIKRCRSIVIEYELKQVFKRKVVKQDRLLQIMQNAASLDLQYQSEQVKSFVADWITLKSKIDFSLGSNLQNVHQYEVIAELLNTTASALDQFDNLGLRIEQDGKIYLSSQLRTRQEELEQLKVIFTESQLQKNPMTIIKLLPSLPKNNPLVKHYNTLKRQQAVLMNKFTTFLAKISQRIQVFKADTKKQRKDQIRQNSEKPSLSQTRELIESFKQSQCDFSRQIKDLQRILANSLEIAHKTSKYCEQKNDFSSIQSLDELSNRRKQIDELRRKILNVAQLNLKTQLTDLYHLQINLRIKNALLTPNLQQDKIGFLLKVAEEENLTHEKLYIEMKERYQTKNQKSKEVSQVKQLQSILNAQAARDTTPNYSSLSSYRRGLPLMDPTEIKIKNSYVEQIVQKNKILKHKIANILSGKTKLEFQDVKPLYSQALKNPFTIPDLSKLGQQVNKTWDIIKRWRENPNKWHSLSQSIFIDYQHSIFSVEEIEIVRRELKCNQDEIDHLKFMVESFSTQSLQQVEEVVQKIQVNPVIKDTPVCMAAEIQYLHYWIKLLAISKASNIPLSYQKLRRLILDAYNLLQKTLKRGQDYQDLSPIILLLERYLTAVKAHLKQYPKFNPAHSLADGFIDLEEFYFDNEEEPQLAELVPLYKPFDDMPKFRVKNLQKIESKREELNLKRSHSKFEQIRAPSDRNIQLSLSSQSQMQDEGKDMPLTVSDNQRRKIKQIFLRNIKKNAQLRKFGDCQNEVKMIENQIFGEWHNDIVKYFQMSEQFEKLFIKLINCPNISNKIIKKKFEFKFINLLVGNLQKIDQLENMVINKLKEQEAVKTITETVSMPALDLLPEPAIQANNSVRIDESAREEIKKEMKLLKESRDAKQSKHKKKKHQKHKDRSHSPEAKFSSDSEKELPKYIQNEYNKQEEKLPIKLDTFNSRISQSPLRYDPEQEQLQKKQIIFPRGSAIKLKTCEAQIFTKKRGRIQFSIDLFTDEQHRKVMQLVDPGFSKLSIRKQKNEHDILPYINKSRKKYRFFVGWFEATNPLQNELLREIALEAFQKKKVFGWQCELIKLHMMSIKQLVTIPKMNLPSKVTTQQAADSLIDDRMIFVLQYPQRLYELKDQYRSFQNLECKTELFNANVHMPIIENKPINDYYHNYTVPTIEPLAKPIFKEPEVVYETWGEPAVLSTPTPPPQAIPIQQQYGIHPRLNQARMQYGFGNYSPILTDSEDNQSDKNQREDLADNLLNSLDTPKIMPAPTLGQNKMPNQPYQSQYYGGYNQYQAPTPQRPVSAENRWNPYQSMSQQQPQHVYNPLNPMAPKFNNPMNPMIPNQTQMGQNLLNPNQMPQNAMNQGQMGQPNMMGMYKNPILGQRSGQMNMQGHYYDPRYQGYQNPQ